MDDNFIIQLKNVVGEVVEEKLEIKLEEKLETKLEQKLDQKLEEKLDRKLEEKLDRKLAPIYQRLDDIPAEMISTFNQGFDSVISKRLYSVEESTTSLNQSVKKLSMGLKELNRTQDLILEKLRQIVKDFFPLKGTVEDHDLRIKKLENKTLSSI